MDILPGVVTLLSINQVEAKPKLVTISSDDRMIFVSETLGVVYFYKLPEFTEIKRIFIQKVVCEDMKYIEETDALVLKNLDHNNKQRQVLYIPVKNCTKASLISEIPINPVKWEFEEAVKENDKNKLNSYLLGLFEPDSNPLIHVSGKTIVIVTKTVAFIWDIKDEIPVFRLSILLPQTTNHPFFGFCNDFFVISLSNGCFVVKLEETTEERIKELEEKQLNEPFTPGTKCFELGEHLNIDCLLTNEGKNSLFLIRTLPGRKFTAKSVFNTTIPGDVLSVVSLSDKTFMFLTTLSTCILSRKITNEIDTFFLSGFTDPKGCTNIRYNNDFVVLYKNDTILYVPNPEKCGEHFDVGSVAALDEIHLADIGFVNCNNKYLTIVSQPNQEGKTDIRILKFEDISKIGEAALKSKDISKKEAAIRLMGTSTPEFAESAFLVAKQLLEKRKKSRAGTEAVPFLITAFNMKGQLTDEQRAEVISIVKTIGSEPRRTFMRYAHFENADIDNEIFKYLCELPINVAARKLIESEKFDVLLDSSTEKEVALHTAISKSLKGNHEEAKAEFAKCCDEKIMKLIPETTLSAIANDLPINIVIRIGRPDLECTIWNKQERVAAYNHLSGKIAESVQIVSSENGTDSWHFKDWPSKPTMCKWVGSKLAEQFVAGCAISHDFDPPEGMCGIYDAVKLAQANEFGQGLQKLSGNASQLNYLREFCVTPASWIRVLEQTNDPSIRKVALHMLARCSPRMDYNEAIKTAYQKDVLELAGSLREADNELLMALSLT